MSHVAEKTGGMVVIPKPEHGSRIDALETFYPTELVAIGNPGHLEKSKVVTTYGYVLRGSCRLESAGIDAKLSAGAFFAVPGEYSLIAVDGLVATIRRHGFRGQLIVGTIEKHGRLSYIDGCSDSLLVYPPRLGDPCLNHLHFPPGIWQSQHTHPSIRMGVVAKGGGKAFRVPAAGNSGWEVDLSEGCMFLLPEQEQHSFRTVETDSTMDVIAYHPDSDWGPTDAAHPMRNRTYIGNDRTGRGPDQGG